MRELGFMQKDLAGTELSPSAVHTIIELGYGTVTNASDLAALFQKEINHQRKPVEVLQRSALDGGFVSVLPVRAPPSEWRCFPNLQLVTIAAKVSEEPKPDLLISRCVRSQRENCCRSVVFYAAARRENRTFIRAAGETTHSRSSCGQRYNPA